MCSNKCKEQGIQSQGKRDTDKEQALIAHFWGRFEDFRKYRNYSVNRVADLAGLSRSGLHAARAGKQSVSLRTVCRISSALETPPVSFF
jgi:hypothetical protein